MRYAGGKGMRRDYKHAEPAARGSYTLVLGD